jgi:site-specific recombinase XerD
MKPEEKQGENDMISIAQKVTATPAGDIETMAFRISRAPTLANLTPEQLEQIARIVMAQRLADELDAKVTIAGIDYEAEKAVFLNNAGKSNSSHTRIGYHAALNRFDTWVNRAGLSPLALTPAQADDFIYSIKGDASPATIRRDVAACSSFFTFLERRKKGIKNPFRGTKARPSKKVSRKIEIPIPEEFKIILDSIPPLEKAIVSVLAGRGLRVGALPFLELWGTKYTSHSKGKDINGTLPLEAITAIKVAGLDLRHPFTGFTVNALELKIKYQMRKLYQAGRIKARYSCHDFRHYFAVREYEKGQDIFRLSKLLNHAGVQITQVYLQGLSITL